MSFAYDNIGTDFLSSNAGLSPDGGTAKAGGGPHEISAEVVAEQCNDQFAFQTKMYHKGIDTLLYRLIEGPSTEMLDNLYRGLSINSNTNYDVPFFGKNFEATYSETGQKNILTLRYLGDPVIDLARTFDLGIAINTRYFITFYGRFFSNDALSDVLLYFTKHYRGFLEISRCDYCIDTNRTTEEFWDTHITQFKKKERIEDNGHLETFYLGRNKKKRTDKHFIRVYDKKADSLEKGKAHLYLDYLALPVVTRIEVEMHTKTIKHLKITPQIIIDYLEAKKMGFKDCPDIMEQHFAALCMNASGTYFPLLESLNLSRGDATTNATFTGKVDVILDQIPYIKTFLGYAERIDHELHFDVVRLVRDHLQNEGRIRLNLAEYVKP